MRVKYKSSNAVRKINPLEYAKRLLAVQGPASVGIAYRSLAGAKSAEPADPKNVNFWTVVLGVVHKNTSV